MIQHLPKKLVLLTAFLSFMLFAQAQEELYIFSKFKVDGSNNKGTTITIFKDGKKVKSFRDTKKFEYALELNANYIIAFEKKGYINKKMSFDTHVTDGRKEYPFDAFGFSITILPQYSDISTAIFTQPVGKIDFDDELDDFNYDKDYSQKISQQMAMIEKQIKDKIAKGVKPDGPSKEDSRSVSSDDSANKNTINNAIADAKKEIKNIENIEKQAQLLDVNSDDAGNRKALENKKQNITDKATQAKNNLNDLQKVTDPTAALNLANKIKVIGNDLIKDLQKAKALKAKIDAESEKNEDVRQAGNLKKTNAINETNELIENAGTELRKAKQLSASEGFDPRIKKSIEQASKRMKELKNMAAQMGEDSRPTNDVLQLAANTKVKGTDLLKDLQDILKNIDEQTNNLGEEAKLRTIRNNAINALEEAKRKLEAAQKRKEKVDAMPNNLDKTLFEKTFSDLANRIKEAESDLSKLDSDLPKEECLNLANNVIVKGKDAVLESAKNRNEYNKLRKQLNADNAAKSNALKEQERLKKAIQDADKAIANAKSLDGNEDRGLQDMIAALGEETRKGQQVLSDANGSRTPMETLNLSQLVKVKANDIITQTNNLKNKLKDELANAGEKQKMANYRKKIEEHYKKAVAAFIESEKLKAELAEYHGKTAPDLVPALTREAATRKKLENYYKQFQEVKDPKEKVLQLSQMVLIKANDLIKQANYLNRKLAFAVSKAEQKGKVKAIIEEAKEIAKMTQESADRSNTSVEGIDLDVDMIHLIDINRQAKHQAQKADFLFKNLSERMPIDAAERILEQIKDKLKLAESNENLVNEEINRLSQENDSKSIYEKGEKTTLQKSTQKNAEKTIEVEEFFIGKKKIKQVTISRDGNILVIYEKIRHPWGAVYYFKNKTPVSLSIFHRETGEY